MKKTFKTCFLLLICCLIWCCNDDFLNEKPVGILNENILAENEHGADGLLIGAYSMLDGFGGWGYGTPWGSAASNWLYGSIAGGDAYKGSDPGDCCDCLTPIEKNEATPDCSYLEAKWNVLYGSIFRANTAIKSFKALKKTRSEEYRNLRIAEARFLRGFYHFEAKKMWNNVPFIDETTTDFLIKNDKDIWPNIVEDFKVAAEILPLKQPESGRVTRGATYAMLGKTYLFQKKYAEAKAAFDKVINSNIYKLMAKYHDNFNAETRNNTEGVFEVQLSVNDGASDNENGNPGDMLNYPYSGGPAGCCGFHQPSQNLVNAFKTKNGLPLIDDYNEFDVKNDQNVASNEPFIPYDGELDPRLDWTVGRRGIPYLDWGIHPGKAWIRSDFYGTYSPIKNVYHKSQQDVYSNATGWVKSYTSNNIRLIRYSDVLLMAAECEVELGNLEQARQYVNQVRRRAANPEGFVKKTNGAPAANYVIKEYENTWNDVNFARKAVRFERRIELGMEGHRFFDLVRWGVAAEEKNAYFAKESLNRVYLKNTFFKAGKSEYYPIPQKAITLSMKNGVATLKQNSGY